MSRGNNVRGPTSALTEFLRVSVSFGVVIGYVLKLWRRQESGITPTTVARRARTREVPQPEAGPSNAGQNEEAVEEEQPQVRQYTQQFPHSILMQTPSIPE